jgi:hypothetical protein
LFSKSKADPALQKAPRRSGWADRCPFWVTSRHGDVPVEFPLCPGGLNRSLQHFILKRKDGVWDGTKIS